MDADDRHGRARREKGVVPNELEIDRPAEELFDFCSDLRNELEWNPQQMESVSLLSPEPVGVGSRFRAKWKDGPESVIEYVEFERPHRWVAQSESALWGIRFEGRVTETVEGSRLDTKMEVVGRGVGRLLRPVFVWMLRREAPKSAARIRQTLEGRAVGSG